MTNSHSKNSSVIIDLPEKNWPVFFITGGDPAGLGPELIEAGVEYLWRNRSAGFHLLYFATGNRTHLERLKKICTKHNIQQKYISPTSSACRQACLNLNKEAATLLLSDLTCLLPTSQRDISPGRPGKNSGLLAFQALKLACEVARDTDCRGIFTAPLSKEWVVRAGEEKFCGHTGYLADYFNRLTLMLMHGESLSVIPLTEHIPLGEVSSALKKIVKRAELKAVFRQLKNCKSYNAPWALCGLNPHAGEGGILGLEEEQFLDGWAEDMRQHGFALEGPFSADGLYMVNRSRYRLIISCYHDQALIPFKIIEGMKGVNCTLGLPFLRTSPAHGTAYEIAGRGCANPESTYRALELLLEHELSIAA